MTPSIYPVTYKKDISGDIQIGGAPITQWASQYDTPLYLLDEQTIRENCRAYIETLSEVYPNSEVMYAGKALLTVGLLNIIQQEGLGVDVVSQGEYLTAEKSTISPEKMLLHGNNKTKEELTLAIQNKCRIVIDNEKECEDIEEIVQELNQTAFVLLRIKPEIEADTHTHIQTGQSNSKFGLTKDHAITLINRLKQHKWISIQGVHAHIGSQIFDLAPYQKLACTMAQFLKTIQRECDLTLPQLNLGGGIGVKYTDQDTPPLIKDYLTSMCTALKEELQKLELEPPKLIVEPGRSIVATAGVTLYKINRIKQSGDTTYLFVDGGMSDNPRYIMYDSQYTFDIQGKSQSTQTQTYDIAGKFCESGDKLGKKIVLPQAEENDILIVYGTGAYNYSMASNYNKARKPAIVSANNGQGTLLVKRQTFEDLLAQELY